MVLNGKRNILKFNKDFIKSYDEGSNKKYILEVDVKYPKHLHSDLPFLSERMKKLVCTIYHKEKYVVHIRDLKQALNHRLILKKYIM